MPQFTCMNCQVAFPTTDTQRQHYRTDWHRYNLKRRITEMPPVSAEEFQRRVLLIQEENEKKSKGKSYTYCSVCKKSFASDQSFQNHLQSKKHIDLSKDSGIKIAIPSVKNIKSIGQVLGPVKEDNVSEDEGNSIETASSGTEEVDSDEWEEIISENNPILHNDCLFCTHHSASLTKNVKHMSIAHSFFIPHLEYLADIKGLLLYLGEKICQGLTCIWCNDRKSSFANLEAVRNHMIDRGHAKIPFDTEGSLEYLDFYNFDMVDDDDQTSDEKGNQMEGNEGIDQVKSNEDTDAVTMLLPSGEVICHRSLIRYFRQNPIIAKKRLPSVKESKVQKLINYYRGLGWNPTQKETVKKKVRDLKYINFIQSKYDMKLRVKANKLQHHFRQQVDF